MADDEEQVRNPMIPLEELENIIWGDLKKGTVIRSCPMGFVDDQADTVHYDIFHFREMMKEMDKLYSKGATRKDFVELIEKHRKVRDDNVHDFVGRIENFKGEDFLKVVSKTEEKDGTVKVVFKKFAETDKKKYVQSIAKKLAEKMTKEQLTALFEQVVMKLNDVEHLKRVDEKLTKEKPKLEGKRGCYKLVVDGIDLFLAY